MPNNRIAINYSHQPLTSLSGDIVDDLLSGSVIIEARNDGAAWHVLVERPIKLADCKGRVDDTWKYGYYQQYDAIGADFRLAHSYNWNKAHALKLFRADFGESRMHQYRKEQSGKNLQAIKDHLAAGRVEDAKDAYTEITVQHYAEARAAFEAAGIKVN